jgi:hypothetical protein
MAQGLLPGGPHGLAGQRRGRHRGVVDHPVDHHLGDVGRDVHRVGGHRREFPGQLIRPGQPGRGRIRAYLVLDHFRPPQATIGAGTRLAQAAMFIPKPTSL